MYNLDAELKVLQDELTVIRKRIRSTKSPEALQELHRQEAEILRDIRRNTVILEGGEHHAPRET